MNRSVLFAVFAIVATTGFSAEVDPKIREQLKTILPGVEVDSVGAAPLKGFYEIVIGTQIVYMSEDGKHLLLGEILDAKAKTNLTKERRGELIANKLSNIDTKNMIVIGPAQPKRYVTVFTDVDCPYCAKFHRDVPKLNQAGVQVRYLLYPRTGVGSRSYYRAVAVWCAKDPAKAIGIAKAGGEIELKNCENPVKDHMQLGAEVGIQGTPAIVLDSGEMIPGYVPPPHLLAQLGLGPKPDKN